MRYGEGVGYEYEYEYGCLEDRGCDIWGMAFLYIND
jgi:hypothetical protein